MKLIVDSVTDKILGAAMVGPDSAEIMQASLHTVMYSTVQHVVDRICTVQSHGHVQ